MFDCVRELIQADQVYQYALLQNDEPISYESLCQLFQHDEQFRAYFLEMLTHCPFESYRFETPGVNRQSFQTPFKFVLFNSPGLAPSPDTQTFQTYFERDQRNDGIVEFENLGGDAWLVVPCPVSSTSAYNHLAQFVRTAPMLQQHSLLSRVGESLQNRISDHPLWLNTAGGGVSWLHIRFDSRPKYYRYQPFKYWSYSRPAL